MTKKNFFACTLLALVFLFAPLFSSLSFAEPVPKSETIIIPGQLNDSREHAQAFDHETEYVYGNVPEQSSENQLKQKQPIATALFSAFTTKATFDFSPATPAWRKTSFDKKGTLVVTLSFDEGSDYSVEVYNSCSNKNFCSQYEFGRFKTCTMNIEPGEFYFKITNNSGNGKYFLDVDLIENKQISNTTASNCAKIACSQNKDCGTDSPIGEKYCNGNVVYQNVKKFSCNNAGQDNAFCSSAEEEQLVEKCSGNCANGTCEKKQDFALNCPLEPINNSYTFSWEKGQFSSFAIQFSYTKEFTPLKYFSENTQNNNTYNVNKKYKILLNYEKKAANKQLFARIRATSKKGKTYSNTCTFELETGKISNAMKNSPEQSIVALFSGASESQPVLSFSSMANLLYKWDSEKKLTDNSPSNYGGDKNTSGEPKISADLQGNAVIVWENNFYEFKWAKNHYQVNYVTSKDEGHIWSAVKSLVKENSINPMISVSEGRIHAVWEDTLWNDVNYSLSSDFGNTWSKAKKINAKNEADVRDPNIAAIGCDVFVAWADNRNNNDYEIYFRKSIDCGKTWQEEKRITQDPTYKNLPSRNPQIIALNSNQVYLIWEEGLSGDRAIYFSKSNDGGKTWIAPKNISDADMQDSLHPSIALDSQGAIYVVWQDEKDTGWGQNRKWDIYFTKSTNAGNSWNQIKRLTNSGTAHTPSIASNNESIHLIFVDSAMPSNGKSKIYYKNSIDQGNNWSQNMVISEADSQKWFPNIISGSKESLHITYKDLGLNEDIYAKSKSTIGCKTKSDCGTDETIGKQYCDGNDLWNTVRTYSCDYFGNNKFCGYSDTPKIKQKCEQYCINSTCNCKIEWFCLDAKTAALKTGNCSITQKIECETYCQNGKCYCNEQQYCKDEQILHRKTPDRGQEETICQYGCSNSKCNPEPCTNECNNGETRCKGNYLQTCSNYDTDSCYEWSTSTSGTGNQYCSYSCSNNQCNSQTCPPGWKCKDSTHDGYQNKDCTWSGVSYCANGCSKGECNDSTCSSGWKCKDPNTKAYQNQDCSWSNEKNCDNGCSDGACNPSQSCTNECALGQTRCNGSNKQTCGNYDNDSCTEWGNDSYCNNGCSNGNCISVTSHAYSSCYNNDLYWFNSSNQREELKQECYNGCSNGACLSGPQPGDHDYCTPEQPCGFGEGNCHNNKECTTGLRCVENTGSKYGYSSNVNVCEGINNYEGEFYCNINGVQLKETQTEAKIAYFGAPVSSFFDFIPLAASYVCTNVNLFSTIGEASYVGLFEIVPIMFMMDKIMYKFEYNPQVTKYNPNKFAQDYDIHSKEVTHLFGGRIPSEDEYEEKCEEKFNSTSKDIEKYYREDRFGMRDYYAYDPNEKWFVVVAKNSKIFGGVWEVVNCHLAGRDYIDRRIKNEQWVRIK